MKIGIIYGTRRKKATVTVVNWLKSAFNQAGITVDAARHKEFTTFDQDAFLIGSAVYAGGIRTGLLEFLEKNQNSIKDKPLATFVVCKEVEKPENHMAQILEKLPQEPISQVIFEGYMFRKGNFDKQKPKAEAWVQEIVKKLS